MLQFQDFLLEQEEVRVRSEKTGRAIDEEVFVVVANYAAEIRKKKPGITREELIKRLHQEVKKAQDTKANPNHALSYNKADESFFVKLRKAISVGSRNSWNDQLEIAVDSLSATINHKDFNPYWNAKGGFKAFRLGADKGNLAFRWLARNLGGSTRTPKTDIAFAAPGTKGLFTASLKDETGGVYITSAGGETGAILESAYAELLPVIGQKAHDANAASIQKQITRIENWMANDDNAEKANKELWKIVENLNELGSFAEQKGGPKVPLGETFLRRVYREAATGNNKFTDIKSKVTHFLKLGRGDKAKFQSIDEHMQPMYKPDKDGYMFSMSRSLDDRYDTNYSRIGRGKHGKWGDQAAAFRVYPMKVAEQKSNWLKIQDDFVLAGDFDKFKKEFGYEISREDAQTHWNKRVKALNAAHGKSGEDYQKTVGYKATKDEIKKRQNQIDKKAPKPKEISAPKQPVSNRPTPNPDAAGGVSFHTDAERATWPHLEPTPEPAPRENSNRATDTPQMKVSNVVRGETPQPRAEGGAISKGAAKAILQKKVARPAPSAPIRKVSQPTPKAAAEKFDWSDIEKAYTTTHDSLEDIASRHNVSPEDVNDHVWSQRLRRPPKQRVAV